MAEEFPSDDFPLDPIPTPECRTVRHALTGSRQGVQRAIHRLHNWAIPKPTIGARPSPQERLMR
jgi:hypothetical protein